MFRCCLDSLPTYCCIVSHCQREKPTDLMICRDINLDKHIQLQDFLSSQHDMCAKVTPDQLSPAIIVLHRNDCQPCVNGFFGVSRFNLSNAFQLANTDSQKLIQFLFYFPPRQATLLVTCWQSASAWSYYERTTNNLSFYSLQMCVRDKSIDQFHQAN